MGQTCFKSLNVNRNESKRSEKVPMPTVLISPRTQPKLENTHFITFISMTCILIFRKLLIAALHPYLR